MTRNEPRCTTVSPHDSFSNPIPMLNEMDEIRIYNSQTLTSYFLRLKWHTLKSWKDPEKMKTASVSIVLLKPSRTLSHARWYMKFRISSKLYCFLNLGKWAKKRYKCYCFTLKIYLSSEFSICGHITWSQDEIHTSVVISGCLWCKGYNVYMLHSLFKLLQHPNIYIFPFFPKFCFLSEKKSFYQHSWQSTFHLRQYFHYPLLFCSKCLKQKFIAVSYLIIAESH